MARNPAFDSFGPLRELFEDGDLPHTYLCLLHLTPGAANSVARIRELCGDAATSDQHICAMFEEGNWRPHLVAAIASVYRASAPVAEGLWRAFDSGSWVQPQLAVAASLGDPAFYSRAMSRLERSCPISRPPYASALESHMASGPANSAQRSAKAFASLLVLVGHIFPGDAQVTRLKEAEGGRRMLESDIDSSGDIALKWRETLLEIMGLLQ
jgi:hypothetical protein